MRFIEGTTLSDLSNAFMEWQMGARNVLIRDTYRRRYEGQRMGQYLWNEFGKADESWPDLFYTEDCNEAFQMAAEEVSNS